MLQQKQNLLNYFCPYGLIKSIILRCGLLAVMILGTLGSNGTSLAPEFTASTNAITPAVFAAAPFNITRIGVDMWALTRLYAPPEYSKVTLLKTQSTQSKPSSCWMTFSIFDEKNLLPRNGGTIGSAPPITIPLGCAFEVCTKIDVWLPNKDITRAPTMNDPNATVILDINPPSEDEKPNDLHMQFHYGPPPPFPGEKEKPDGETPKTPKNS